MTCPLEGPNGRVGTLRVEFGIGRAAADGPQSARWDVDSWDDPDRHWSAREIEWIDVTEWVRRVAVDEGATSLVERFRARSATVELLNDDGTWTWGTGAPSPGLLRLRPTTPVRISVASTVGPWEVLFTGSVVSLSHPLTSVGTDRTVVQAADALIDLGRIDPVASTSQEGNGDTWEERISRILDWSGIQGLEVDVAYGRATFQATSLAQPTLTELLLTADSEGGFLWVDRDGTLLAYGFDWLTTADRSTTPQAVLGNAPSLEAPHMDPVCPSAFQTVEVSADRIENVLRLARGGGQQRIYQDPASQAIYGIRSGPSRMDLIVREDDHVDLLGLRRIRWRSEAHTEIEGLEFAAILDPADLAELLALRLGDLVDVTYRNPAWPSYQLEGLAHVVGTRWEFRPRALPSVTVRLDSADAALREAAGWDGANWDAGEWNAALPADSVSLLDDPYTRAVQVTTVPGGPGGPP